MEDEAASDFLLKKMEEVLLLPDVMFLVVSLLSFDDAVAFHDAFPSLWPMWTVSNDYVSWFKGHLYKGVTYPPPAWKYLALSSYWQKINFNSYVQHVHYHRHGGVYTNLPKYRTEVLQLCGMPPRSAKFLVKACIFLPRSAPSPFSGNLVLLGLNGELASYRTEPFSYVPTTYTQLDFCPDTVCCSPKGTLLLLPSSHGQTSVVILGAKPCVLVSDVCVDKFTFKRECFWRENVFLTWDVTNIVKHVVTPDGKIESVRFCSNPPFSLHRLDRNKTVFWVKPRRQNVQPCLVFGEISGNNSLSTRLRIAYGGPTDYNSYISFERQDVRVCDCLLHPRENVLFVMCVHKGCGKLFFSQCPSVTKEEPELTEPSLRDKWFGTFCFYSISFQLNGQVNVTPRFFAGKYSFWDYVDHWGPLYSFTGGRHAKALCTDSHLSIKFQEKGVCHFSLIATPLSQPFYVCENVKQLWAISHDHRHHVFFSGDNPRWEQPVVEGYRTCPKYDKAVEIKTTLILQDFEEPMTITVNYV